MSNLQELLVQRDALEQQIKAAREREISDAVAKVRALVAQFNLTAEDVFGSGKTRTRVASSGAKVAPKYRDPATGNTWTGRGKPPRWLAGQDKAQFLIK